MSGHLQDFPVVRLVDTVLDTAVVRAASDIHFEPTALGLRIRFRIDGVLYEHDSIDATFTHQLVARLKVLANMNIAEKRIPQDGKFRLLANGADVDLRVSTFPTAYGEKVVVRILDRADYAMALDRLGLNQRMQETINHLIYKSSGFFLVCGPTGSGKTTTLYACLNAVNNAQQHIITLEDPIEYHIPGIIQGQIHPDAGFTFEKGIRALLRQDPDIVMIGEIRDKQTARIAIEAALSGHLIFSTIHTSDAPSVVMRLMDMGIEPYLINASITGVLAQRLARKLCTFCREKATPSAHEQVILNRLMCPEIALYIAKGCSSCMGLGYKGRTGIFELLPMTSALRTAIVHAPSLEKITQLGIEGGMTTLLQDGLQKVQEGIISLAELMRVVG